LEETVKTGDTIMTNRPYSISIDVVEKAFEKVKANKGCPGIDNESIEEFEKNLERNLYRIWNQMSSGSYFPPAVRAVEIPKKNGGKRRLGIPTVGDRVAQTVVKNYLEPRLDKIFLDGSYGYRLARSANKAVGRARQMCWKYDYVVEFDIKGLFDNIDHELLMKAVDKHVKEGWMKLYILRWLKAPFANENGEVVERTKGTPQGGAISPLLANLFLHYVFDVWMQKNFPNCPFERFADDAVIHCKTEQEALDVLKQLDLRMKECKLELHPDKTHIVYCKDSNRRKKYPNTSFDFLGYTFRSRRVKTQGKIWTSFLPAVSRKSQASLREKIKALNVHRRTGLEIGGLAKKINPVVGGWINYFKEFYKSEMAYNMLCLNRRLCKWVMRKYKSKGMNTTKAWKLLETAYRKNSVLFAHWKLGWPPCREVTRAV
jgi:group II intron reverse transcriptase/maturase